MLGRNKSSASSSSTPPPPHNHPGPALNLGGGSEAAEIPANVADLHCFTETSGVITTTMFDIPGYKVVRVLGTVYGLTVRTRNWAAGLGMVAKSIVGGELTWFTSMLYSARNDAIGRVVSECQARGGNAVIALRFDAADLMGFSQVCAYGTACLVEKVDPATQVPPQLLGEGNAGK